MTKPLLCVLALLVSSSAHAASATLGIDWNNLTIELIDLDPNDGIAPLHDTSRLVGDHDSRGEGPIGNAGSEALSPYGARYFAIGADSSYSSEGNVGFYETTLSPNTAAIFSVAAFASVSFAPGELASASVAIQASAGANPSFSDGLAVSSTAGPNAASRLLSVRVDNLSSATVDLFYGYGSSVYVQGTDIAPIPEVETWALFALGLPLVAAAARRRRTRR